MFSVWSTPRIFFGLLKMCDVSMLACTTTHARIMCFEILLYTVFCETCAQLYMAKRQLYRSRLQGSRSLSLWIPWPLKIGPKSCRYSRYFYHYKLRWAHIAPSSLWKTEITRVIGPSNLRETARSQAWLVNVTLGFTVLWTLCAVISGSLSPRHGASSGRGWRNGLRYGGYLRTYWISSRGQPTGVGPPAWGLVLQLGGWARC